MLESSLATMGWVVSNYLNAGVSPQPMGNENFTAAPSGTFRTGDGLLNIAANETKQFVSLCQLIGRADLLDDPRFSERNARKVNRMELKAQIEAALASDSAIAWDKKFTDAGVPVGRVMSVPEILAHPHLESREFVCELQASDATRQRVTRAGFRISGGSTAPSGPAPLLSADTHKQLATLGYSDTQIEALRTEGVI
jgi:crotonobetainyl-CoA:carnitine CoA-transferase CaiB-like acyl-CoA transferase